MDIAQKTGSIVGCGEDYMILLPYYEYEMEEQTRWPDIQELSYLHIQMP